jgi:hypothetical protein
MSFTNPQLRMIIQEHFAKENKKMSNISKATKKRLEDIIDKYKISLPTPEKKEIEQIDATNHLFKLGEFVYRYKHYGETCAGCAEYECWVWVFIKITRITKCFITFEYKREHFGDPVGQKVSDAEFTQTKSIYGYIQNQL